MKRISKEGPNCVELPVRKISITLLAQAIQYVTDRIDRQIEFLLLYILHY